MIDMICGIEKICAMPEDTLENFVRWFLLSGSINTRLSYLQNGEHYDYGSVLSSILYRDSIFQAELFTIRPNSGFPRYHRHPDVDSFEYCPTGDLPLLVRAPARERALEEIGNEKRICRVDAEDWHTVGDVPNGGYFLSLQKWKNGVVPTSAGKNWTGSPVSLEHRAILKQPNSKWIRTISRELHL